MITVEHLSKRYGPQQAVSDLSFAAPNGQVTGFVGPNGAGKSTTMRLILGLDHPDSGRAVVDGEPYTSLPDPLSHVGALLEAKSVHPGRTARAHLKALAATHGLPSDRVDDVLDRVGLRSVEGRRLKGFSLGMSQRLGLAAALLGDPSNLVLDEPVNGLDPEGVVWVRDMLRYLASEGRAVLVSSHLMAEMAQVADRVVVIGRGRLIVEGTVADVVDRVSHSWVQVRTPQADALAGVLVARGASVQPQADGALRVEGPTAAQVGDIAAADSIPVHELFDCHASLEEAFMRLTHDAVAYGQQAPGAVSPTSPPPAVASAAPGAEPAQPAPWTSGDRIER